MKSPRLSPSLLPCLFALLSLCTPAAAASDDDEWKPVDPAHLAMKSPVVERDADAEVLFWEVRVGYSNSGREAQTVLSHYVRVKIFTERGRESQSRVDIFAPKIGSREIRIKDVAGRTIKPDGTILELKKEDVF